MTGSEMTRAQALSEILRLMQAYGITLPELGASGEAVPERKAGFNLQALLGYLGAAFIFAGIGTYIGMQWDGLTSFSRVALSFGSGLVILVLGLMALRDARLGRLVTPFLSIGAFLQTTGLFIFLTEYATGGNVYVGQMGVFGVMAAQMALLFFARRLTVLAFWAVLLFMGFAQAAMMFVGVPADWVGLTLGVSGILIAAQLDKTAHRGIVPLVLFFAGSCVGIASFEILDVGLADLLLVGVSGGLVWAAVALSSRVLLSIGLFHFLWAMADYTRHYFKDIVGWPVSLILMGVVFIVVSVKAIRLGQRFGGGARAA